MLWASEPAFLCGEPVLASVELAFLGCELGLAAVEPVSPDCASGIVVIFHSVVLYRLITSQSAIKSLDGVFQGFGNAGNE